MNEPIAVEPQPAYWSHARQPLACLLFLLPLLAFYELGVVWFGTHGSESIRNGADSWLRGCLQHLGFQHPLLLPSLVVVVLLGWQCGGRYPWRVSGETLAGMLAESLLFAFCLVALGQLQDVFFQHSMGAMAISHAIASAAASTVTFIGAGVYEEVMFRLCLLPAGYGLFRLLLLPSPWATGLAAIATSVLFAAAHHVGASGDPFSIFRFSFRTMAGLFFAALFVVRGFGITVGCHAAYDLVVGILLSAPESP